MPEIDLQDPFQGRRWLRLVVADDACGFRLKRQVKRSESELGFSCTTNRLGLRGACDEHAGNVVFGTSYAMGVGANDGETWNDLVLPPSGWLNLGLAVGVREWSELTRIHHRGPKHRAILMYHPNIWAHCVMYERWRASGKDVFTALNWRTDFLGCSMLSWRRRRRAVDKLRAGELIEFDHQGARYSIDAMYARISMQEQGQLVCRGLDILQTLLEPFSEVWCVKIPIKQQLVPPRHINAILKETQDSYDALWRMTSQRLHASRRGRISIVEAQPFELGDYHPKDTHWNSSGNARFASWLQKTVMQGVYSPASK